MKKEVLCCVIASLCLLLSGCRQDGGKQTSSPADSSKTANEETQTKPQQTSNLFYRIDLTERESFYLHAFNKSDQLLAYDARWELEFSRLEFQLYRYQDKAWKQHYLSSDLPLSQSARSAWFVISSDLSDFRISSSQNGMTPSIQCGDILDLSDIESYELSSDILEKKEIKENEEFAVIASRYFAPGKDAYTTADLDDFQHPENVSLDKDEEYFMLTFRFSK